MLTQERVRALYAYDAETGIVTRRISLGGNSVVGSVVGAPDGNKGYLRVRLEGKTVSLTRIIWLYMTGELPALQVDHKDRNKINNRWQNLRLATNAQNKCNSGVRKDSGTGIKGVHLDKRTGRYRAKISVQGKRINLGFFATLEEAAKARADAEHLHGEFSNME